MQRPVTRQRLGSITSLVGVASILLSLFLPLYTYQGNATALLSPETTFQVATSLLSPNWPLVLTFLVPLLLACFIGAASAMAFFRDLSPRLVWLRRVAARAGFVVQFLLVVFCFLILSIGLSLSISLGLLLSLFGFALTLLGTAPQLTLQRLRLPLLLDAGLFLILALASGSLALSTSAGIGLVRLCLLLSAGLFVGLIHLLVAPGNHVTSRWRCHL